MQLIIRENKVQSTYEDNIDVVLQEGEELIYSQDRISDTKAEFVNGEIKITKVDFIPTDQQRFDTIRFKRDKLLTNSDWTMLSDCPITNAQKIAWETYRQELRDLPSSNTDPSLIVFPTPPIA